LYIIIEAIRSFLGNLWILDMSALLFHVNEHIIPCQHIREYARATAVEQEDVLQLAVKQYIPLDNLDPKPGDITIIGAHANGFPKVLLPETSQNFGANRREGAL
jgi:hypothetical protein